MSTLLKWTNYGFAWYFVFPLCGCKQGIKQQVGSIALFFGWMNFALLIRRVSSHGKYIIMLITMFITLLKVLLLFLLFILAFSSSFYMLMDDETEPFSSFPYSMMTILVMTLGELNYADLFMPSSKLDYSELTNILFVLLVLGMPIILMNMLVGLAVGDVHKIQAHAATDRYVMQVESLLCAERTYEKEKPYTSKHVEYPNKDQSLKALDVIFGVLGLEIIPPEDYKEENETSADLPHEFHPLLKRMENQENSIRRVELRINGIYDLLKEQSSFVKSMDQVPYL